MQRAGSPDSHPVLLPPLTLLTAGLAIGFAVAIVVTTLAARQPWIGMMLVPDVAGAIRVRQAEGPAAHIPEGATLVAVRGGTEEIAFEVLDFAQEPDGTMGDYGTYKRFLERQERLSRIQRSETLVFVEAGGGEFRVIPDQAGRPLSVLPVAFWVQVTVGLVAWLIAAAVFAFRMGARSARYLLLSGVATLTFAPLAAVYSTRELGLPGELFRWLNDLNFLGGSVFAASFVGLLLYYPRAIARRWVGPAIVGLYVVWFALQQAGVFESMTFARRFLVMLGMLATFVLAGVHWFGTRRDPVGRAALQWFLLSWVVGTSVFGLFILLPQMFGIDTSALQGYAFLLFLLVYGGLGFGIMRFRLFDLGAWWGRTVVWTLAILLLVVLDLLFLLGLHLSSELALSLALLTCGLVWLPLRALVWGRLMKRPAVNQAELFRKVVDVALTPPGADQPKRWRELLGGVFDPLQIEKTTALPAARLEDGGVALRVPGVARMPPLRLEHAQAGRKLFTPADVSLAEALTAMLRHVVESRTAYEKGVAQERARMAREIHDHIGAQLLGALHSREEERKDTMIRAALADLRDIINDAMNAGHALDEVLAGLRVETAERLSDAGIELRWEADANCAPVLNSHVLHALRSITREAVSNVIKHAEAKSVQMEYRCEDDAVVFGMEDDGKGFEPARAARGRGLTNIDDRVTGLGGEFQVRAAEGAGTSLRVRVPLGLQEEGA